MTIIVAIRAYISERRAKQSAEDAEVIRQRTVAASERSASTVEQVASALREANKTSGASEPVRSTLGRPGASTTSPAQSTRSSSTPPTRRRTSRSRASQYAVIPNGRATSQRSGSTSSLVSARSVGTTNSPIPSTGFGEEEQRKHESHCRTGPYADNSRKVVSDDRFTAETK